MFAAKQAFYKSNPEAFIFQLRKCAVNCDRGRNCDTFHSRSSCVLAAPSIFHGTRVDVETIGRGARYSSQSCGAGDGTAKRKTFEMPQFKKQPPGYATKAVHIGLDPKQWTSRSVASPIHTTSIYQQDAPNENQGFIFARYGNPNRNNLEHAMAILDDGKYGLLAGAGMGAITNAVAILKKGDHIVAGESLYGGTDTLLKKVVPNYGIDVTFANPHDMCEFSKAITPKTKMVWLESPTNPLMNVVDIAEISGIVHAKQKDIIVVVDNTLLSSYYQRPLELGADIVAYSLTKYLNGHSDVVMGGLVTNNEKLYQRMRFIQTTCGIIASPFDCYQAHRGLKTIVLRMERHMESALKLAHYLESHKGVERVLHPGLPSHPHHAIALKQTYGYGGVFSFYLKGGREAALAFLKGLEMISLAVSMGGLESTIQLPALMTHNVLTQEERDRMGISDNLIRLSVGLEDLADLKKDLEKGLKAAQMK